MCTFRLEGVHFQMIWSVLLYKHKRKYSCTPIGHVYLHVYFWNQNFVLLDIIFLYFSPFGCILPNTEVVHFLMVTMCTSCRTIVLSILPRWMLFTSKTEIAYFPVLVLCTSWWTIFIHDGSCISRNRMSELPDVLSVLGPFNTFSLSYLHFFLICDASTTGLAVEGMRGTKLHRSWCIQQLSRCGRHQYCKLAKAFIHE
jgi:hypothetical protein